MPTPISSLPATRAVSRYAGNPSASEPARELEARVLAARAGDQEAWSALVERFDRRLRRIARAYRLAPADVDDVVQSTWLRGLEHIGQLREPDAIGAWLERITRRECLRLLQVAVSECPTDETRLGDRVGDQGPEERVLALERREVLCRALQELPRRQRRLMTLVAVAPASSYRQISALVNMPIGSIGPTRERSLARLRRNPGLRALRGRQT